MIRLAVLALLAASCANDGGVIINVTPSDPSVTVVRLYIGNGDRTTDATLAIPTSVTGGQATMQSLPGVTYWPRDERNELDSVAVTSGGTARFVMVRTDTTDIGAIIAVGYAGNQLVEVATLFDVHLPSTKFNEYTLTLAKPAQPPFAWGSKVPVPAPEAACIGVVDPRQASPFTSTFIVSPEDQDCDGLIVGDGRECNPDVWFGRRPANLDELTCVMPGPDAAGSCYLGGPECIDDRPVGMTPACAPTKFCTPKTVCSACMGSIDCAKDVSKLTPNRPSAINCPLRTASGNTCEDELVVHTGSINGIACTSVAIADATHDFSDRIDRGTYEIVTKFDETNCRIALKVKGTAPSSNTAFLGLMLAIELDNGRGVALPVVLYLDHTTPSCANADVMCIAEAGITAPELLDCAVSWSPPMLEGTLVSPATVGIRSPTLTGDMLDIWFTADEKEVWTSHRDSLIDPWKPPVRVMKLEAVGGHTPTVRVSPDGLTMYLSSERAGAIAGTDLYKSTRNTRSEQWVPPVHVPELSGAFTDEGGSVDRSGSRIVFSVTESALGPRRMYQAVRATTGDSWAMISALPPLQSNNENPHLVEDGSALYYTGEELGAGKELFTYQRAPTNQWSPERRILELGSQGDDIDAWVSLDQRVMYFASDRNGSMRIYRSQR